MKKYLAGLGTGLLMVGTAVTAGATTTTFTDVYTPATSFYTGSTTTYSFLHDITDNGFSPGVIGAPGVDTITSAVLRIYTHDDDSKDSAEKYKFTIDNTYVDSAAIDPASTTPYSYTFTQLDLSTFLQPDGKLNVSIFGQNGDFYFDKSELAVTWDTYAAPVPEPATMLLLGSGLAGLAATRRRKMNN